MATEVYQPPQEQPITSKVYTPPTLYDTTVYEDPNKVLFLGDVQFVGYVPTVTVA